MDLTITAPATLETFFLVAIRASTLLLAAPMLSARFIPPLLKIGLSLLLALVLTPLVAAGGASPLPFGHFLLAVGQEIVIGLLLAFAVTLIFGAIQFAAAMLGLQFGFSLANVVDPTVTTGQETVIGQFYSLLAGLVFFTINGHHHVLTGLARSFDAAPPAGLTLLDANGATITASLLALSAALFTASLRIAVPIMGALLLADVALAVIARTAPQMNVYFVGLPIKILIGLIGLLLALPLTVTAIERLMAGIGRDMLRVVGG